MLEASIAVVGLAILLPGKISTWLTRVGLSVPLVALLLGVALGPEALGVLDPAALPEERRLLEEAPASRWRSRSWPPACSSRGPTSAATGLAAASC